MSFLIAAAIGYLLGGLAGAATAILVWFGIVVVIAVIGELE